MVEFFNHLNEIHPLSPEAQAALLRTIRAKELRKGQVWLQEGCVCDKFSFVVKGLMKLYFESTSKELVISFSKDREFCISARSYFSREASRYAIRTLEPSVVLYMHLHELTQLTEKCPELNFHLKKIAEQQVVALEYHNALLMLPAKERYLSLSADHEWMVNGSRLTDKMLAAYLGVGANAVCQWRKDIIF